METRKLIAALAALLVTASLAWPQASVRVENSTGEVNYPTNFTAANSGTAGFLAATSGTAVNPTISGTMTGNFTRSGTTTGGTISNLTLTGTTTGGTFAAATLTGTTSAATLSVSGTTSAATLSVSGTTSGSTLIISGSVALNGNTTLGDASGDTLTINAGTVTAPNTTDIASGSVMTRSLIDARSAYSYTSSNTVIVTNSTTLTDSGLTVTLSAGIWEISQHILVLSSGYATAGCKASFVFSGTATELAGDTLASSAASATSVDFQNRYTGSVGYLGIYLGNVFTYATFSAWISGKSIVSVTAAGTLKVQVAQYSAVAAQTVSIGKGSFIIAKKISY
jgi:hypothetical protein